MVFLDFLISLIETTGALGWFWSLNVVCLGSYRIPEIASEPRYVQMCPGHRDVGDSEEKVLKELALQRGNSVCTNSWDRAGLIS